MYVRCSFSNFVLKGQSFHSPIDVVFCKYQQHQYCPFEIEEFDGFNQFLQEHKHNFQRVEIVNEDPFFDLYDIIRSEDVIVPITISLDSPDLMLLARDNSEIPVKRFAFTPVGVRSFY
jgi:hypothetical protein